MQEAAELAKRGKEIKEIVLGLQREERAGSKGSKWKKNLLKIQQVELCTSLIHLLRLYFSLKMCMLRSPVCACVLLFVPSAENDSTSQCCVVCRNLLSWSRMNRL